MTATRPRDLLTDALLGQLGGTAERASGQPGAVAADIARLAGAGDC